MKKQIIITGLVYCLLQAVTIGFTQAQYGGINVTTTAVPFLQISPDARAGGMANMGVATSPDADAGFHNLSKTIFSNHNAGISANYNPWLKEVTQNMYLASLAGYYKLDETQALSASMRYFSMGNIEMIDYSGNSLQTATPREYSFDLGYTRKLADKLSIAVALRYIYSNLASGSLNGVQYKAGNALAGDVSMYYNGLDKTGQGWTFGLALTNLGSKISYTDNNQKSYIPANAGIGAAYTTVIDEENKITFSAEYNKLLVPATPTDSASLNDYYTKNSASGWFNSFGNKSNQIAVGAEYNYNNLLSLRTGYYSESANQGGWKYFTAGLRLSYSKFDVNVSYLIPSGSGTTKNPLSNTLRFGIAFNIDK